MSGDGKPSGWCFGDVLHGDARNRKPTSEYRSWQHMRDRCSNPSGNRFQNYGGRGISVCDRWSFYSNFLADMGRKPSPFHSLDRIDVNRGYEPGNCRWATQAEQQQNRTSNKLTWPAVWIIRAAREAGLTLQAIAGQFGVSKQTISHITTGRTWKVAS